MHFIAFLVRAFCIPSVFAVIQSTQGIEDLVRRRLPNHAHDFSFKLVNTTSSSSSTLNSTTTVQNDHYAVSSGVDGTIQVEGNSPIALASGSVQRVVVVYVVLITR